MALPTDDQSLASSPSDTSTDGAGVATGEVPRQALDDDVSQAFGDSEDRTDPDNDELERFDIAEYFFTEVDRQWFCTVTSSVAVFTDQFTLDRAGGGWFERFGQSEWSRHEALLQLEVETASGETFSIREIFATNTVLEFQRFDELTGASEIYDCVLTLRDIGDL